MAIFHVGEPKIRVWMSRVVGIGILLDDDQSFFLSFLRELGEGRVVFFGSVGNGRESGFWNSDDGGGAS
jgi:hypothetical protein